MRYLYLLFFCFLSLHSYLVFAQENPLPSCASTTPILYCNGATACADASNSCLSNPTNYFKNEGMSGIFTAYRCQQNCVCPPGSTWYNHFDVQGNLTAGCSLDGDGDGGDDESCPSGYPKVNGQCPVCPTGFNEDGTCATPSSEPASSAPNSSSPDSGSSGSAGSAGGGGDDDGGGTPGGGGSGPGNGGDNGGGGSAGSASAASASSASGTNNSWNPYAGYGNWIPVAADSNCPNKYKDMSGQWWCAGGASNTSSGNTGSAGSAASAAALECDPTASTYFSCINQKSVNGGAGWNPHASYGGWLPINEDSPCVNKFQDKAGDWWCAAPSGGGGGGGGTTASSAGSSGSSGSDGASGSEGSASSKSSTSSSHSSCSSASAAPNGSSASNPCSGGGNGSASSSGSMSSLGEKGEFDGEASEKRLEELGEELTEKIDEIKLEIQNEFTSTIQGSGSIEDFCKQIRGQEVCFGMKKFEEWLNPISSAIFLVACVISFSIVLSGRT
ncbi:hypothetical protein O59_002419 [Cellvibrio sp. BR]|uniref:hypothetical protein n=1 Tax=Cellvibrio sp. BR TaxID=1134474 RepID=UPI000260103C|nr:hypothetical protein [Cellvibrio sp. BR]EIK44696.1 hypothetical protein O59_002419 [Cellvibrio sp. BR]